MVIEMDPDDDRCNEGKIKKPLCELDQNAVRNQEREDEAIRRVSTWKRIIRVKKKTGSNISDVNKENQGSCSKKSSEVGRIGGR